MPAWHPATWTHATVCRKAEEAEGSHFEKSVVDPSSLTTENTNTPKHLTFTEVSSVLNFLGYEVLGYEVIR